MNPLTNNPDIALMIAHRTIDDRIHDAQQRDQARAARAARRAGFTTVTFKVNHYGYTHLP